MRVGSLLLILLLVFSMISYVPIAIHSQSTLYTIEHGIYGANFYPRFRAIEIVGAEDYSYYPIMATTTSDVYVVKLPEEVDDVKVQVSTLHAHGVKHLAYRSLCSVPDFGMLQYILTYYNLTPEEYGRMDLNGTYVWRIPNRIVDWTILLHHGREKTQDFEVKFLKLIFDSGMDGIQLDSGSGDYNNMIGAWSFDPESMEKFNEFLSSKYTAGELLEKFGIEDISKFNFREYLLSLGYKCDADLGVEGPQYPIEAKRLWQEFMEFNLKNLLDLYRKLHEAVEAWKKETGREFVILTNIPEAHLLNFWGRRFNFIYVLQYVSGLGSEFSWEDLTFPNRTGATVFKILLSLNKTFLPWLMPVDPYPWFTVWARSPDPEEQYLALAETIVYNSWIDLQFIRKSTNPQRGLKFVDLVVRHPYLFGNQPFAKIALVYPLTTVRYAEPLPYPFRYGYPDYEGMFYLLADSHRLFDIVVFGDNYFYNHTPSLGELQKYDALILSNATYLTDEQVELLLEYVRNGGILIGVGEIGTHNERGEIAYRPEFTSLFDGTIKHYGNGIVASITENIAVEYLVKRYYYDPEAKDILNTFKQLMDQVIPPFINTNLAGRAHIQCYINHDRQSFILDILNYNYDFNADKVIWQENISLSFDLPSFLHGKDLQVKVYTEECIDGTEVPFTIENGKISISIPEIPILCIVEVKPKEVVVTDEITSPTTISDSTITISNDLVVHSNLTLINVTVNVDSDRDVGIEVLPGGSLVMVNTVIRKVGSSGYYLRVHKGAKVYMENVDISSAGIPRYRYMEGIFIETNDVIILKSSFHDSYGFGLQLMGSSNVLISNCKFYSNRLGLQLFNSSLVSIVNCNFSNNGCGLFTLESEYVTVDKCTFADNLWVGAISKKAEFFSIMNCKVYNSKDAGIYLHRSTPKVFNCEVFNCGFGVYTYFSPIVNIISNSIHDNENIGVKLFGVVSMLNSLWGGIHCPTLLGQAIVSNNLISGNLIGIYADTDYFRNEFLRVTNNTIQDNHIGIYVSNSEGIIAANNFINNDIHINATDIDKIYLNYTIGNYWDNYSGSGPYEALPGLYDYLPLKKPAVTSPVSDYKPPIIKVKHVEIDKAADQVNARLKFYVLDDTWLAKGRYPIPSHSYKNFIGKSWPVNCLGYFSFVQLWGPKLGGEHPFLGFCMEILPPEVMSPYCEATIDFGFSIPAEQFVNVTMEIYCFDAYGNFARNETLPPEIVICEVPLLKGNKLYIYALVQDYSEVSKVMLLYGSNMEKKVDMKFDEDLGLYYAELDAPNATIKYKVVAYDIYGKLGESSVKLYIPGVTPVTIIVYHYDFEIFPETISLTVEVNELATYTFTITNVGDDEDTYYITCDKGEVSPTTITLAPGESAEIVFKYYASATGVDECTIVVKSSKDPNVIKEIRITITVTAPALPTQETTTPEKTTEAPPEEVTPSPTPPTTSPAPPEEKPKLDIYMIIVIAIVIIFILTLVIKKVQK